MYNVTGPVVTNRSEGRPRFSDENPTAMKRLTPHSPDGVLPTKLMVPDMSPDMMAHDHPQDTSGDVFVFILSFNFVGVS